MRRSGRWVHHHPLVLVAALGVVGMVLGEGAFGQHRLPAFVPCVGRLAPPGGVFGVVDAGGRVGESLELPAGLEPWPGGQVGPRVCFSNLRSAL